MDIKLRHVKVGLSFSSPKTLRPIRWTFFRVNVFFLDNVSNEYFARYVASTARISSNSLN